MDLRRRRILRIKEEKAVFTFRTTLQAMQAERSLKGAGCPGRIIPVPRDITAGCGMAWCAPVQELDSTERFLKESELVWEQTYRMFL